MSAILSNRSLQFYNNETVFDLSLKQTSFLPQGRLTEETIAIFGSGETIESVTPTNIDVLRYLTGLARYKTTTGEEVTIGNIAKFDGRVTIRGTTVSFEESFQFEYRIPFSKIVFVRNKRVQKVDGEEQSLFYESFQDIKFYFRSLEWVKIFYSLEVFIEFLQRGDFEGQKYNLIGAPIVELMERCEQTISNLVPEAGLTDLRFVRRPSRMDLSADSLAIAPSYSDLNINTLAQVPETLIKMEKESNLEAVSDLRFIVDENYNFLSREFEFGPGAPANRFYTGFEESLMPSGYLFSVIKYLESLKDNLSQTGAPIFEVAQTEAYINVLKERLFFGPFDLEPYERGSQTGELTRDLYNKFGISIKNLDDAQFEEAYGDLAEQQKRRLILIDPTVSQNFNFQSLFPFGNRIEISDLPSSQFNLLNILTNYNLEAEIMLNLMNGTATPASEITSRRKKLSITDYFTGRPTTTSTREAREFDFSTIFNNTTQPFTIDDLSGQFSLPPARAEQVEGIYAQVGRFNSSFTTPYRNNLNLTNYRNEGIISNLEFLDQLKTTIGNIASDNLPNLEDLFLSGKNNYFEIFAYKVVKRNTSTSAQQQFFIFNRPEELVEFFDTQVKPNQEYEYSLSALAFVLENFYRYEIASSMQLGVDLEALPEEDRYVLGSKVRTSQQPKIIELPLAFENSVLTDAPPTRPNVEFYPVKDFNDRVKIRVSSMSGTEHALPVVIESGDVALFRKIRQSQKVNTNEKIRFHTDETPAAFEVFRLEQKPESIQDFVRGKRIIRSVTSNDQSSGGTSFMDGIVANVDYYYLFRTLDFHGNISNPTEVFKFTLVDNEGALQPLLSTFSLEEMFGVLRADGSFRKKKKDTNSKNARRFIKIRPNAQEISFVPGQFNGKKSEDVSSVILGRGALPSSVDPDKIESQNNIINQRYMLELKSKKTGKSIFIEFKYVLNNFNIATLERRTMVPDTVTERDIQDAIARRNEGGPGGGYRGGGVSEILPPGTSTRTIPAGSSDGDSGGGGKLPDDRRDTGERSDFGGYGGGGKLPDDRRGTGDRRFLP
jgi:hypothetical protein